MRTLAIGDIHGCSKAFDVLLNEIKLTPRDKIITLGDYINKGPDSKGVIERLIKLSQTGQLIPLKGNHEQMLLEAYFHIEKAESWGYLYGQETLVSYGNGRQRGTLQDIPKSHWYFIAHTCVDWWETKKHLFVHANLHPNLPLHQQSSYDLFWKKFEVPQPHYSGKTMICGHTSQKDGLPLNLGHAICLDTWACGEGWLTGLDLESGRVWQANQKGQVKTAWIEDFCLSKNYALVS